MANDPMSFDDWKAARTGGPLSAPPAASQTTEAPAGRGVVPFATWKDTQRENATERANIMMEQAIPGGDAVKALGLQDLAGTQGLELPADMLTNATSALAQRIEREDRKSKLQSSSQLAGWINADPINAALAKDELQNLSGFASIVEGMKKGSDRSVTASWYRARSKLAEDALTNYENILQDQNKSPLGVAQNMMDERVQAELKRQESDYRARNNMTDDAPIPADAAATLRQAAQMFATPQDPISKIGMLLGMAERYGAAKFSPVTTTAEYESIKGKMGVVEGALDTALEAENTNARRIDKTYGTNKTVVKVGEDMAAIGEIDGMLNQLTAIGSYMVENPGAFSLWMANVTAESLPPMVGAAVVGAVTKKLPGGLVGEGATRVQSARRAAAATMGGSSLAIGEATTFDQFVKEGGYDLSDPEQRMALVKDPAMRQLMRDRAFAYGAVVGLFDGLSGNMAGKALVANPVGDFAAQAMAQAAMGGGGEFFAQIASGQQVNMVEVVIEGLAEFATAPLEATFVGQRYARERMAVAGDKAFFEALAENAEASDMRAKVPKKYREMVENLTKDGAVETLYVDAQSLDEMFQSRPDGVTIDQFLKAIPGVDADAFRAAVDSGGAIEIPTASYATDIVGTPYDAMLREHLKTSADKLSAFELRKYESQIKEMADTVGAHAQAIESGQVALEQAAEDARQELVSSLRKAGRPTDVAEREALQAVAFAATTAKRLGITMEDFLTRYPLANVQGALETTNPRPSQVVTVEAVERLRAPPQDSDDDLIKGMREAAEAAGVDMQTATPADIEDAVLDAYGPAAGPVMLNQMGGADATPEMFAGALTSDTLRRPGWGVVTAARQTAADAEQNAALEAELKERGIRYVKMEGVYKGESDGQSFMIFAPKSVLVELGGKYNQESVLNNEGLVYMDGSPTTKLNPDDLATGDEAKARDFHSVMEDGTAWSAGFEEEAAPLYQSGTGYDVEAIKARAAELAETLEKLPGAPNQEGASGPDPMLIATAEAYAASIGQRLPRQAEFVKVDETLATRIATAYDAMGHSPTSPVTKNAYAKLIEQTVAQYRALEAVGYKFWFFDDKTDPYGGNPWDAMRDLRANQSMAVYATEAGYGSGATDLNTDDNPLLAETGIEWPYGAPDGPKRRVLANDLFRAVHDAFGHGIEGAGFRARGEENAWQAHVRLFTGWAVAALTTETRGQNSWLNYGPHGEANRTAGIEDTVFADQKAGLLPEWAWEKGRAADEAQTIPVDGEGMVVLTHWSDKARATLDPRHAGKGPLKGAERNRRGPKKVFYGVNVGRPGGYRKENLGNVRHTVRVPREELYDLSQDPDGLIATIPDSVPSLQRVGWLEERLRKVGYKGYVVMDSPHGATAALFDARAPETVRTEQSTELFQSGASPDFFSALTREVEGAKQKSAMAKDWMAIIQKLPGVKKAEIDWSGVQAWLAAQEGQVAREDVAAFLRENEVEVVAVTKSGASEDGAAGVDVSDYGEIIEEDDDYLRESGWEQYGDELKEEKLEELNSELDDDDADPLTEDDLDEETLDGLREDAYQRALDNYNDDPNYTHSVAITTSDGDTEYESIEVYNYGDVMWDGNSYRNIAAATDAIRERYADEIGGGATKWEEYTETGKYDDYREVLLTVPALDKTGPNAVMKTGPFQNTTHFDEENIVVHARLNYRKGAKGEKVLFVEEVQSDLGSHWREKGGAPDYAKLVSEFKAVEAANAEHQAAVVASQLEAVEILVLYGLSGPDNGSVYFKYEAAGKLARQIKVREGADTSMYSHEAMAEIAEFETKLPKPGQDGYERIAAWLRGRDKLEVLYEEAKQKRTGITDISEPITPFEGEAYYALMMKKLLKIAAEEGADKLAWTPAYMQARRWSGAVQNVVQGITWRAGEPKSDLWSGVSDASRVVTLNGVNGEDTFLVDENGVITDKDGGGRIPRDQVIGKPLSDLIGGTMAKRILGETEGEISGENIVIGGDGFKISYDQQIKKFVEKFAKKYGSKVTVDKSMPAFAADTSADSALRDAFRVGAREILNRLQAHPDMKPGVWEGLRADFLRAREKFVTDTRELVAYDEVMLAEKQADYDEGIGPDNEFARRRQLVLIETQMAKIVANKEILASLDGTMERFDGQTEQQADEAFLRTVNRTVKVETVLLPEERESGDAVWSVDITPAMRVAAMEAQPLFQKHDETKRGSILLPTEPGKAPLVTLFAKADLSTFLHESGHYFLHVMQDVVAKGNAPEGMAADWEALLNWWSQNVEGIAKDGGVSEDQVRLYMKRGTTGDADVDRKVNIGLHEQFARGYEAYLLEGKAPSNALRAAFESFSAWLLSIYRSVKGLNVEINDELRGVFDRMLATDEEIAAVSKENGFDRLVASSAEQLGISADEYAKLVRLSTEAQDEAKQALLLAVMAPIRRARTEEWRAERDEVEAEMAKIVNAKPANRLREWLGNGRWLGEGEPQALPAELRLDRQILIDEYGEDVAKALPRGKRPLYVNGTGLSADDVAGWFGYKSGSEMLDDMTTSPNAAAEIKGRTDAEMRKRYPDDPLADGTIEAEAVKALQGEKRGQLIAAELSAIAKVARKGKPTSRAQAAEAARRAIRAMQVRKAVRSGQYEAVARRAADRAALAVAKGNLDEAYAAKREQLLNHQLYIESKKADEILAKTESRVASLKKKSVRKNLAGEYLEAIDDILATFDFRKSVTGKAESRRGGLLRYVEMMKAAGRENELAIPAHVLDEAKRRPYRTLTVAELEGVLDSLRNIEHTARLKKKLRDAQSERDLTAVVEGIVDEMDVNLKDKRPNRVATPGEKARGSVREFANLLLNADSILRKLGGFTRGAAYDAIKQQIDIAADWASVERAKAAKKFEELYSVFDKAQVRRLAVRKHYKELGGAFTKWDLISAVLNMGNADNLARLMDKDSGSGFTAAQVEFIKNQMTQPELDFVESVWEFIDSYWPLIEARERRMTGVVPAKVAASEVLIGGRTLKGGYYPIRYRGDISGMVAAEELASIQQNMMGGRFGKAQTRNGHLQERANGSGGRVLQLGMEVLHQHIGQVVHDLAFSEPVANAWRVLQDPRVRGTFEAKGLLKDHQSLELWLQDTATGQAAAGGVFGRLALRAKNGFTLSKLAFNLSSVAIQLTGITQSIVVLGSKNMAVGYGMYLSNPMRTAAEVVEMSPFMRERETTFNRDINDILGDVMVGPVASRMKRFQQGIARLGFWLMQKVQFYGVDVPTWYAGLHQGHALFAGDEAKARLHADRMVARAQASGVFSDRSAFERGTLSNDTRQNGFVRLFTTLGSYMFAKGNVAYEVLGRTGRDVTGANIKSIAAALKGAADLTMLFTVEAIAYNLIKGTLPGMGDGDDDDDGWPEFLAKETVLSMMSTVPGLRDVGSALSGFDAGAYGSIIQTFVNPIVQASQGEVDMALFKALSSAAGVATGLPSGQLNRVADAWYRLEEGEDVSPIEFIMGRRR